jgi:hypothetical protein
MLPVKNAANISKMMRLPNHAARTIGMLHTYQNKPSVINRRTARQKATSKTYVCSNANTMFVRKPKQTSQDDRTKQRQSTVSLSTHEISTTMERLLQSEFGFDVNKLASTLTLHLTYLKSGPLQSI